MFTDKHTDRLVQAGVNSYTLIGAPIGFPQIPAVPGDLAIPYELWYLVISAQMY
jgi:hypothetical protein